MSEKTSQNIFNKLSKLPFIALVALPSLFFGARGEYLPYLLICFAGVALTKLMVPLRKDIKMPPGWIIIVAMGMVALGSQYFSVYARPGREVIFLFVIYGYIYWRSATHEDSRSAKLGMAAIASAGTFVAAYGLYRYFGGVNEVWGRAGHEVYIGRLSGTYLNPNHAACLLVMAIPAAVYFTTYGKVFRRVLGAAAAVLMAVALVFTFSRGGMLSAVVMCVFVFLTLILKSNRQPLIMKVCAIAVVFVLLVFGCLKIMSLRRDTKAHDLNVSQVWRPGAGDDSLEARYALARDSVRMIEDRPITGSGPGTYQYVYPAYRSHGITLLANAAHNDYLQNAAEMGLLFGILFLCFIIFVFSSSLFGGEMSGEEYFRTPSFYMLVSAVGFCAFMLVDFNLRIPANGIIFFYAIGVVASGASNGTAKTLNTGTAVCLVLRICALVVLCGIVFVSINTIKTYTFFVKSSRAEALPAERADNAEKAFAMDKGNYEYALNAAEMILKKGIAEKSGKEIQRAIRTAEKAATLNVFDGRAESVAAKGEVLLGRKDRAEKHILNALEIEPLNAGFMDYLVYYMIAGGRKNEALKWVEKSCRELPDRNNHFYIRDGRWDHDIYSAAARGFESVWNDSRDYEAIRGLMMLSREALRNKDCELPLMIRNRYEEQLLPSLVQWTDRICGNFVNN